MSENFTTPAYAALFRRVFEFEKYGRKDIYWIELEYYIDRHCFVSRVGQALDVNLLSFGGIPIFAHASDKTAIAAKNMVLIKETPIPQLAFQDIYKVTELYGFAPNDVFVSYGADIAQIVGLSDETGYFSQPFAQVAGLCEWDSGLAEFTLNLGTEAVSHFSVGEEVRIYGAKRGAAEYNFACPTTTVLKVYPSDGKIVIGATGGSFDSYGGEFAERDVYLFLNRSYYENNILVVRNCSLVRKELKRVAKMRKCWVKKNITYHNEFPTIEERFAVTNSTGAELDTIDDQSTPNLTTWKTKINNGEFFNIDDSEIDDRYAPQIYIRTTKTTKCR